MANIRKSFNFRNGVQVDNDNFVVNANGLVGIGTSVPTEAIDAIGNAKISGLTTTGTLGVAQTATFFDDLKVGSVNIDPTSGVITATKFVGDASGLTNIVAISTVGWISEGVGLHTISKSVGIGTTDPLYALQIGEDPASGTGIGMTAGNILVSGIVTAVTFDGNLSGTATTATNLSNAANITTGTISDNRLPNLITSDINSSGISTFVTLKVGTAITMSSGIITATTFLGNVTGDLTGLASTATKLENSRDFSISGDILSQTASFDGTSNVALGVTLSSSFSARTSGIITANTFSGIVTSTNGTFDDLRINKTAGASLVVTSTTNSQVSIGQSTSAGNQSAQLLYTPGTGRLDINNYDVGGVSVNLHEGTGAGTTESFNVKYDNAKQFEVTYDGKVGINRGGATLTENLEVGGNFRVTNDARVAGVLTVNQGGPNEVTLGDGSALPMPDSQNFNTVSGISTFNNLDIANNLSVGASITSGTMAYFGGEVGIGTTNNGGFLTGPTNLIGHAEGSLWAQTGYYTAGKIIVTDKVDGSVYIDERVIPGDLGSIVPTVDYGGFQIKQPAATFFTSNFTIVPSVGVATVGFGSTNGALIPSSFQEGGNRYLTNIGINTYYARSILDVGTASTTMNSYFIPPSLTQAEIDIMATLPGTPTATGHAGSKLVTPDGVVPGALLHNKTTDTIQVGASTNTFRNISPVVAFATINSGTLVSTDSHNLGMSNNTNDANFTFSTTLPSANYTVIVSYYSAQTFSVPEAQKTASGFRVTFSSSASGQSYAVMVLQL
tara:strand:- start:500 stop:2851 length:2352 start_codon:yes stop_codon:yes gene_type:complete